MKRGIALAGLSAVLFGLTAPLLKRASADVGTIFASGLTYLGAALGAAAAIGLRRRDGGPRATGPRLFVVALLGAVLAPVSLVAGLRRVDGATASLLLTLEAPFTIALARLFLRERVGGRVVLAALLICGGGATLVAGSAGAAVGAAITLSGALLVVGATLAWALDNLLSRALADTDALDVVARKGLIGAVLGIGAALATRDAHPSLLGAAALMGIGAVGYGASLALYLRAQHVVGAARTASVFAAGPFVGVVVAFALGAPWPGAQLPVAAVLIAIGVALHVSERHDHTHTHEPTEHEHMHRHDDGHHDHHHDPMPAGPHSHVHRHDRVTHSHEHGEDPHHRHEH